MSSDMPLHWVVIRLGHLGDVMLTTGVLSYLSETKGWSFTFVTTSPWSAIFAHNPFVRDVVTLEKQQLLPSTFPSVCRSLAERYKDSGLLDLHGSLRSRLLSLFWHGKVLHYPKYSLERRLFLTTGGKRFQEQLQSSVVTQRYAMAVETPPPPAKTLLPRVWLTRDEYASARAVLDSAIGAETSPVALHPYATHALKSWPEEHWLKLIDQLDRNGLPWVILGKGESPLSGRREDLTNTTSLRETMALLSYCRCLVTGDSGPMHMAVAVGTPVIALFGPTTREWGFFPTGDKDMVLEQPLKCRPCSLHGKQPCPRNGECLSRIVPEEVFQKIKELPEIPLFEN